MAKETTLLQLTISKDLEREIVQARRLAPKYATRSEFVRHAIAELIAKIKSQ